MIVANHFKTITKKADIVGIDNPIEAIIPALAEHYETRTVYVVDGHKKLVGIIDATHVLRLAVMEGVKADAFTLLSDILARTAEDIMQEPVCVTPEDTMDEALRRAVGSGLQDLPVVDANRHVIGDLNCFEILGYIIQEQKDSRGGPAAGDRG